MSNEFWSEMSTNLINRLLSLSWHPKSIKMITHFLFGKLNIGYDINKCFINKNIMNLSKNLLDSQLLSYIILFSN